MLALYDKNKDRKFSISELMVFFEANGVQVTRDQAMQWFQPVDDEGDGFDAGEIRSAIRIVDAFPSASTRVPF